MNYKPDTDVQKGRLTENIKAFVLAGTAIFTIRSTRSGQRFTYKVRQPNENRPHFVRVLTGPDNTRQYVFLGTIFDNETYRPGKKSPISQTAPSSLAFVWAWGVIVRDQVPETLEVWHEGRCGRCGKKLTVPESIESGFGPHCRGLA